MLFLSRIIFLFLFFLSSVLYSQEVLGQTYTLREFLQEVRKQYIEISIKELDSKGSLVDYQFYIFSSNSPRLFLDYTHNDDYTPGVGANIDERYNGKTNTVDVGINQTLSYTRTQLKLGYKHSIMSNERTSTDGNLETKSGEGYLEVNQPLLYGGLFVGDGLKEMNLAKEKVKSARINLYGEVEKILIHSLNIYYDYLIVKEEIVLAEAAVRDSKLLYDQNKRKINYGAIEVYEFLDSEIFYEQSILNLKDLEVTKSDLEKEIALLLGLYDYKRTPSISIEGDLSFKNEVFNPVRAKQNAKIFRNDYRYQKSLLRESEINLEIAKLKRLPRFDLFANVGIKGYESSDGDNSLDFFSKAKNPTFTIGFKFEVPIIPSAFRLIYAKEDLNHSKNKKNIEFLEYKMSKEIDKQVEALRVKQNKVSGLSKVSSLRERSLADRRKHFNNGKIDLATYISYYEDVRKAKQSYLQELKNFEVAKSEFEVAQGIFLRKNGIEEGNPNSYISLDTNE